MGYDLSALVYIAIAVILLIKLYVGSCGGGTCG
jgi:hypothetical protein